MMALGYSGRWIAEQLGHRGQTNVAFILQHRTQVTLEMAQRVDALARRVGDRPGPSERARRSAYRSGWRVPGAYTDEGDLIPGAALADEEETQSGRVAVRRQAVQQMLTEGLAHGEIAQRLGVSRYVIEKDISRGGLEQMAA
jgi:DNA-directed RNA polymerase specialized sigma24 family protein